MGSGKNILWTFVIGLIAGIAPFLFMKLLPALLNPTQSLVLPNYLAILLTGVLVGATTAIIFAKTFDARDPQEVFVYALGIPAILIATVSNLSTTSEAKFTQTMARIAASNAILNVAPPPLEPMSLQELAPPTKPAQSGMRLVRPAWAEGGADLPTFRLVADEHYVVVIGQYSSEAEAWKAVAHLRHQRLNTELYIPKQLRVFKAGEQRYYVSYSAPVSREEAVKLFRLLRINDPQLEPQILKQMNG